MLAVWPKSNADFWKQMISVHAEHDKNNIDKLPAGRKHWMLLRA